MILPNTQNAAHQSAFKKGFRSALNNQPLSSIPNNIAYDEKMRDYFQLGWQQAQNKTNLQKKTTKRPLKTPIIWGFIILLVIILIATIIFYQATSDATHDFKEVPSIMEQTPTTNSSIIKPRVEPRIEPLIIEQEPPAPSDQNTTQKTYPIEKNLTLPHKLNKPKEELTLDPEPIKPLSKAEQHPVLQHPYITIEEATLGSGVKNREIINPFTNIIPKDVNRVYFFTKITGAKTEIIYHRWIYKDKIMATIALQINSSPHRTWSSKKIIPAWQGKWTVEVLDKKKNLIYQQNFKIETLYND